MVVTRSNFDTVLQELMQAKELAADSETTGLRPFHGDRLFSLILAPGEISGGTLRVEPRYFNFYPYPGIPTDQVLPKGHLAKLKPLFEDPDKVWYFANATFDLHMLAAEGITVAGEVHDVLAVERIVYNEYAPNTYNLAGCGARIGVKKDDTVEKYITENKLYEDISLPGKKTKERRMFFYKVPYDLIVPYGCKDTIVTAAVAHHQSKAIRSIVAETAHAPKVPTIARVVENEKKLTKTVWRMEQVGLKIDRSYCERAAAYEQDRAQKAIAEFKKVTGRDFVASGKLFAEVFADEKDKWEYTEKGNPSFESDVLKHFQSPAAKAVQAFRDAKSKADFYLGFLRHADRDDVVHPSFNQGAARTGRFSSSNPNFQNLTSEEDEEELEQEFVVRRAIVPRPGYILIMPDYDQMEYRMMFDYACDMAGHLTEVARQIRYEGKDPHQATADTVTALGTPLTRKRAKNGNFAFLYGSGYDTLAKTIGSTREEAMKLKNLLRQAMPEVQNFIDAVSGTAKRRGFIINWAGRRAYFPVRDWSYKAPNSLIQGGCADVTKFAMTSIDEEIIARGYKSRMIATIHDELPTEVHESEVHIVPRMMKEKMESVYPWKYLPLTAGMEWSDKSLADKKKGFPA